MKKVIILAILAVLLLVVAYFALFYVSPEDRSKVVSDLDSNMEEASEEDGEPLLGVGTLTSLWGMGQNLECNISSRIEEDGEEGEGTLFISGETVRGDFLTPAPDLSGEVMTSIIIKDNVMYLWSDIEGESYGMRMDISDTGAEMAETNSPLSLQDDVRYNCKKWRDVDPSVFVPPGDVLFQDFSELFEAGMEEPILYEEGEFPF